MKLVCNSFENGAAIPHHHGRLFGNIPPSLVWEDVPDNAVSLVLFCLDPDALAGIWTHWAVYNIPKNNNGLPPDMGRADETSDGIRQGLNSWGEIGYDGPQPPFGVHRYIFTLYALDIELGVKGGASIHSVEKAMKGHIVGTAELMGKFGK
ncbi:MULTISPECIES: YbhB/YbcL family Raf kinase inhibitor-like protein [Aminobacterium]|jgi:hypothetical protein|uniref:YbhB/YbcL family Raf kinase inhibitor-like protein n=1 Tax=Aminobacterium TaxID=81466 RepID=UPI002579B4FE|nr:MULTISPECIES: YbhB/YbcL family Raf kinase inhibitor-like protein [unclassified Aminobacterium]